MVTTHTEHTVVADLETVQCLPCTERIQLLEAFAAAGPHTVEQFELRALASTGSHAIKQVISELGELTNLFRSNTDPKKELPLCLALDAKRSELETLKANESEAVANAKHLVHELQAKNLLVDDGTNHVRPSDEFPTPAEIEAAF